MGVEMEISPIAILSGKVMLMNNLSQLFPFWEDLTESEKTHIEMAVQTETYKKGMLMHRSDSTCKGLMAVVSGRLRTYILSEEGREVTLFRVAQGEVCVLSASCLLDSITFDVMIEATEDAQVAVIPAAVLNQIMGQNHEVELYLYKAATEKFSDVMWTMQQILFLRIDQRIAQFLWDEMIHRDTMNLQITHDEIAKYIGSAREVVTKVMKYLAQENVVELKRGSVTIIDKERLRKFL